MPSINSGNAISAGSPTNLSPQVPKMEPEKKEDHMKSATPTNTPPGSAEEQKSFSQVWNDIQQKYGEKPKPPREIKKSLGKDDFLKLMITQMKNQDPTKPFDADKMAQEMAQITSVEQLQNISQAVSQLGAKNQPLERMAMIGLIGKTMSVDRNRVNHTQGESDVLRFNLPKDAAEVKVSLVGLDGDVIYEKDLGSQKQGVVDVTWDGKKKNTLPAKSGTYLLKVEAKTAGGAPVAIQTKGSAKINGVTFEGVEPAFLVGDSAKPEKVALSQVTQIKDEGGGEKP